MYSEMRETAMPKFDSPESVAQTQPTSEIGEQYRIMNEGLTNLSKLIEELHQKIYPIMLPPQPIGDEKVSPIKAQSELGLLMQDFNERINRNIHSVRDMVRRIQL